MSILVSHGNESDKDNAYKVYVSGLMSDLDAKDQFPVLEDAGHLSEVDKVHAALVSYFSFTVSQRNHYRCARVKVGGAINGPATTLKYDFRSVRNFTNLDATVLEAHLNNVFPHLVINVQYNANRPIAIVQIGP